MFSTAVRKWFYFSSSASGKVPKSDPKVAIESFCWLCSTFVLRSAHRFRCADRDTAWLGLLPVWQRLLYISLKCQISHDIAQRNPPPTPTTPAAAHRIGILMCLTRRLNLFSKNEQNGHFPCSNIIVKENISLLVMWLKKKIQLYSKTFKSD